MTPGGRWTARSLAHQCQPPRSDAQDPSATRMNTRIRACSRYSAWPRLALRGVQGESAGEVAPAAIGTTPWFASRRVTAAPTARGCSTAVSTTNRLPSTVAIVYSHQPAEVSGRGDPSRAELERRPSGRICDRVPGRIATSTSPSGSPRCSGPEPHGPSASSPMRSSRTPQAFPARGSASPMKLATRASRGCS